MPRRELFLSVVLPLQPSVSSVFLTNLYTFLEKHYVNFEVIAICDHSSLPAQTDVQVWLSRFKCFRFLQLAGANSIENLLVAGCEHMIGDILVALNPDSDPIELIPDLAQQVESSQSLLIGQPSNYHLTFFEFIHRKIFYFLCQFFFGLQVIPNTSQYIAMNRTTANSINGIHPKLRFYRALAGVAYGKVIPFSYICTNPDRRMRRSFWASLHFAISLVTANTLRPYYFAIGLTAFAFALQLGLALFSIKDRNSLDTMGLMQGLFYLNTSFVFFSFLLVMTYLNYRFFETHQSSHFYVVNSMDSIQGIDLLKTRINVVADTHIETAVYEKK